MHTRAPHQPVQSAPTAGRDGTTAGWRCLFRPALYGFTATLLVLGMVWKVLDTEGARHAEEGRAKTYQASSLVRAQLERALNSHIYLTRGLVGIVRAHPDIPQQEFETIARELVKDHTGIRSLQLARDAVVTHVFPLKGNEEMLGIDLRELPGQAAAVERAIGSGRTIVAGPLDLIQGGVAFVSRTPIFVDGPGGVGETFWGLASLIIGKDCLLHEAELASVQAGLRIALRGKDALGAEGEVFLGDPAVFEGDALLAEIRLPHGSWQLGVQPASAAEWLLAESRFIAWFTGAFFALAAGGLVGLLAYRPQQVLRMNAELQLARLAAERAAEARGRFLAAASHDLRQPLHALGIFVRELVETAGPQVGDLRPLIDRIQLSVESLTELIHSVMDISRLDAGVVRPNIVNFPLRPLLERLAVENAPYAMEKGLRLRVAPTRAVVRSDPILLESMLRNLVVNAIKYTPRGGILLGCRMRGSTVRIEVWDTGQGIPAAEQKRVFEEFYQLGNADHDRRNGLGLGLSIVRRLADLLDLRVDLRSQSGRGTVFAIEATLAVSPLPSPVQDNLPVGFNLKCLSIMIVDDELLIRQAMQGLLEQWGCRVVTAADGAEAEALFKTRFVKPNLLLCDFTLRNGERGDQVIMRLRDLAGGRLEAVLISGHSTEDVYRAAEACGSRFLSKPVAPAKLRALLRSVARESLACGCPTT